MRHVLRDFGDDEACKRCSNLNGHHRAFRQFLFGCFVGRDASVRVGHVDEGLGVAWRDRVHGHGDEERIPGGKIEKNC